MTYCTLISTEQTDKLKSNPKTSYLMYFNIPSDQAKISSNTLQQKFLIHLLRSELLHF